MPKVKQVNKTHMRRLAKVCAEMLINSTEKYWADIELEVVFLRGAYYPRGIPRGWRVELTDTTDRRIIRVKPMLDFLYSKGYSRVNSHEIHQTKRIASIKATFAERKLIKEVVDFSVENDTKQTGDEDEETD